MGSFTSMQNFALESLKDPAHGILLEKRKDWMA
jgi:hypothetical protein